MGKKKKKKKKGLIEITGEDDETAELADELNDLDLVTKKKKKKAKIIDLPVEVSRKSWKFSLFFLIFFFNLRWKYHEEII